MRIAAKLTWITVTVLGLSAEASAMAQSTPAPANRANDPALARMAQESARVAAQLEAARASLAKKADTGASLDLNRMEHQASDGNAAGGTLVLPNSAGAPIASNTAGADGLQVLHVDTTGSASSTAGPATRVTLAKDVDQDATPASAPSPHAEAVIRGQLNPALRSCYEHDPDAKSRHAGRLVLSIKVTPEGAIDAVNVASNVDLSSAVTYCIVTAAYGAKFAAPGASGSTIRTSLAVPGRDDPAAPDAASAKDAQAAGASHHAGRHTLAKVTAGGETAHR
jgi:hypothetical protein